jgi:hypothetical protein
MAITTNDSALLTFYFQFTDNIAEFRNSPSTMLYIITYFNLFIKIYIFIINSIK